MSTRIFITGGASGLGREIALRWAREGARVCIGDLNAERGSSVEAEIRATGAQGVFFQCDVTKMEDLRAIADDLRAMWGGIDIVVNNAGVATAGRLESEALDDWQWVLNINLLGVVRGCQAFTPTFRAQGHGHFVNIASMAGLVHPPGMGSYNASKAAVVALSETLRLELGSENICVTVVCPSFFQTNLAESLRSSDPNAGKVMNKLFSKARITAAEIADRVYFSVRNKRFLVLPHRDDRKDHMLKRFLPVSMHLNLMTKITGKSFRRAGSKIRTAQRNGPAAP